MLVSSIPSSSFILNKRAFSSRKSVVTSSRGSASLAMYDKIFVAGAARGVGRIVVEKLSSQGKQVVAFVRRAEAKEELEQLPGVTVVVGNALEQKVVENAMDGCDCAITTLGTAPTDVVKHQVDYTGNINVLEAAGILGVTRVVLITSIGCGSSRDAISDEAYEMLKGALLAKEKAEKALVRYYTNAFWTVIRPAGLLTGPATGQAVLTENTKVCGAINRADVADLIVRAIDSKSTFQKVLSAVDPSASRFNFGMEEFQAVSL